MVILAGTGRGVYALDGDTPRQVLASRGVRDLVVIDGRVFASTGAGVFCSDDGGRSFHLSGLDTSETWLVRGAVDGTLYAGTQPAALYRSCDNGDSWEELPAFRSTPGAAAWCVPVDPPLPGRARAIVVDADDPLHISVGVEVGGIVTSRDGGETWSVTLPGDNPDLHVMVADPANGAVIYASTGYGRFDGVAEMVEGNAGVYRSDDRGESWHFAFEGVTPRYSRPMCIDDRAPHALTVAAAPTAFSSARDPHGAGAMLFRSENGGRSWRSLCDPAHAPSHANFHGLGVDPTAAGSVLVGTDTGEVWRVGGDAEWQLVASGMPAVLSLAAL